MNVLNASSSSGVDALASAPASACASALGSARPSTTPAATREERDDDDVPCMRGPVAIDLPGTRRRRTGGSRREP
jgi:hypothetical protein